MHNAPDTLRSVGVPPKPVSVRRLAWATYEVVRRGRAVVEVQYVDAPDLLSIFRVEVKSLGLDVNGVDPLYAAAYRQACAAARAHGYEMDRFTRS